MDPASCLPCASVYWRGTMGSCGRSFKGFLGAMPGDQGQNQRIRDTFVALVWSLLRFHARGDVRSCIENRCPKFGPNPAPPADDVKGCAWTAVDLACGLEGDQHARMIAYWA